MSRFRATTADVEMLADRKTSEEPRWSGANCHEETKRSELLMKDRNEAEQNSNGILSLAKRGEMICLSLNNVRLYIHEEMRR